MWRSSRDQSEIFNSDCHGCQIRENFLLIRVRFKPQQEADKKFAALDYTRCLSDLSE
jgi:hypothetical protein